MTISTRLLAEQRDAIEPLVAMMEAEWPGWYNTRDASARSDLSERVRRDGLPLGLVAYCGGAVAGTCALTASSGGLVTERSPWIGGLVVAPPFRGRGVAGALLTRARTEARRLGYGRLHALTASAAGLFLAQGWSEIDAIALGDQPHAIFAVPC